MTLRDYREEDDKFPEPAPVDEAPVIMALMFVFALFFAILGVAVSAWTQFCNWLGIDPLISGLAVMTVWSWIGVWYTFRNERAE